MEAEVEDGSGRGMEALGMEQQRQIREILPKRIRDWLDTKGKDKTGIKNSFILFSLGDKEESHKKKLNGVWSEARREGALVKNLWHSEFEFIMAWQL